MDLYKDQLMYFFVRSGLALKPDFDPQLDGMTDDEVKILYDIVFAPTEKDRVIRIDDFYKALELKEETDSLKHNKELTNFKLTTRLLLQQLKELWEKAQNENTMDNNISLF